MENIKEISIDLIDDPEFAMRSELDRDGLFDLAENIKQNGLINPITVRPKNNRYEVVAGHRRLCACKIAGKIKINCVVRELSDEQVFEIMTAENIERADVDPVDEAIHLSREIERTGKSVADLAKQIRRSVAYVESRLAIGQMPDYMQEYLKNGQIKIGVALNLFEITDDARRRLWVEMAVRDGISVAQAELWLHHWKVNQLPGGSDSEQPPENTSGGQPSVVMFECSIDGKKYDARLFKTYLVYEGNAEILDAFIGEFRKGGI